MKKLGLVILLSLSLNSCTKTPPSSAVDPGTPVTVATASPVVVVSASPETTEEALGDPMLPPDVDSFLTRLPAWTVTDRDLHPWWTQSGISDNGLRAFVSDLEPAEVEQRLLPFLQDETRLPLPSTEGFYEVEGSRLALYAKEGDSVSVAALGSPLGQPPQAWEKLGLPPLDWASNAALLEGKKTVVVMFAGYGSAEYLRDRVAANATPTPAGEISPTETPTPDTSATP